MPDKNDPNGARDQMPIQGTSTDKEPKQKEDKKVDQSVDMTFPASDPPATGKPTSTEEPKSRPDRAAPTISKEDIERAQRGAGHKDNSAETK